MVGVTGYLHWTLGQVLAWWLLIFLVTLFSLVLLGLGLWLWRAHDQSKSRAKLEQEYLRQEQERTAGLELSRLKAEAELQETNSHAIWRPIHLNPRQRINGVDQPPTLLEIAAWEQWQAGQHSPLPGPTIPVAQLAGATLPERVDLLELTSGRSSLRQIVLGVRIDEHGQIRVVSAPLNRMVHIGAAGATDSGKSNFGRMVAVQVAIAIEDVVLVFVDLKETTFKIFREMDRLRYPIITTPADFIAAIEDLYGEMERRKRLFAPHLTVETLADYNKIAPDPLPLIVVFVDEVTNLFTNKETQRLTLALIRKSRGFGIHFITLGQSWSH